MTVKGNIIDASSKFDIQPSPFPFFDHCRNQIVHMPLVVVTVLSFRLILPPHVPPRIASYLLLLILAAAIIKDSICSYRCK